MNDILSNSDEIITLSRDIVINDYKSAVNANRELFINGDVMASSEYIFDNQKEDAKIICNKFYNTSVRAISIIKRTKVGMDGLMIEIAKNMATHPDNNFVLHRDKIFFITAMSNKAWEIDMKHKMPNCFQKNVFHHGQLQNLTRLLKEIKNALIIIDEIDTGDKGGQKLHILLKNSNVLDIKYMDEKNIRFVFVSATIVQQLKLLKNWGDKHWHYKMTIPNTYIGHKDFLELGIIKEFYAVNDKKSAKKWIKEDILQYYGDDYRVHIIRTDEVNKDFISKVCKKNNIIFKNHTSDDRISREDLLDTFNDVSNHIVIAVKGFYRRANLIPNKWKLKIGATHEKYVNSPDTNVQIQGLPGRMSGYWKESILNGHKTGPHRTSIKAMHQYETFYENPFGEATYNSRGGQNSFVNPKHIKNLEIKEDNNKNEDHKRKRVPIIIEGIDKESIIFTTEDKKERKKELILHIQNNTKYEKLYNFISSPNVKCIQVTQPTAEQSYKKHITDTINASNNNTPYSIDVKPKYKVVNNWQAFIDNKEYRICILVWSVDDTIY